MKTTKKIIRGDEWQKHCKTDPSTLNKRRRSEQINRRTAEKRRSPRWHTETEPDHCHRPLSWWELNCPLSATSISIFFNLWCCVISWLNDAVNGFFLLAYERMELMRNALDGTLTARIVRVTVTRRAVARSRRRTTFHGFVHRLTKANFRISDVAWCVGKSVNFPDTLRNATSTGQAATRRHQLAYRTVWSLY